MGEHYMLKVAGAVRRQGAAVNANEDGSQQTVELFFVNNGPFVKLSLGHQIIMSYTNGTSVSVGAEEDELQRRRLGASWTHIGSSASWTPIGSGRVGLSGL